MSTPRLPLPMGKRGTILVVIAGVVAAVIMGVIPYKLAPVFAEFERLPMLTEVYVGPPWWVWPAAMAVFIAGAIGKDRLVTDPELQFGWNLLLLGTLVVLLMIEAVAMVMPFFMRAAADVGATPARPLVLIC